MAHLKSPTVTRTKPEAFILNCNKQAMDHLHAQNPEKALSLLLEAEEKVKSLGPSSTQLKLRSITLNNLGCFYKRAAQPQKALEYLQAALVVEAASLGDKTNLAGTHLNICAIKSQIGLHEQALQHATEALQLLTFSLHDPTPNIITTVVIAHHNAGVEYEYLKSYADAVEVYRRGLEIAKDHLGPEHPLVSSLHRSYFSALEQVDSPARRHKQKRVVSVTPAPAKGSPVPRQAPRRSASKGTYDTLKQTGSPSHMKDFAGECEDAEEGRWMDRKTIQENQYGGKGGVRAVPGIQLQPLQYESPRSKHSRRNKTHSAPNSSYKPKTLRSPVRRKQPESARTYRFRKGSDSSNVRETLGRISSPIESLESKASRNGSKPKRRKRTLEVVNILSSDIRADPPDQYRLVSAMQIYLSRKQVSSLSQEKRSHDRKFAEQRAQAAIEALEELKRQAYEDARVVSTALPPKTRAPSRTEMTRRMAYTRSAKTRELDVIPEAGVESKAEFRKMQIGRVQSWFRTALIRREFLFARVSIVRLQRWTRMLQTRRLYLGILSAVQFIQQWWRIVKAKRRVGRKKRV